MVSTEYNREVCIMQNAETVLNVKPLESRMR